MTSPDSARATDPRATETVLELRLGARFGSGTGERDRERALEEAAVVAAARQGRCSLVAGQLPKGRGGRNRGRCRRCGGCVRASGGASAAQDPGDPDRNGVLELGQHGELRCKPAQVITARHDATKSTAKGTKIGGGRCAEKDRNRCCETGSARARTHGRQRRP